MKISEIITKLKSYYLGYDYDGNPIKDETSRDKLLYGSMNKECTGIVITCWPSAKVIEEAGELGANFIICHEAIFWNHGDQQDWLKDNNIKTYISKVELLDKYDITVWRNHDYIHSGMPIGNNNYSDGIFYGLMKKLEIEKYLAADIKMPIYYEFPKVTVEKIGNYIVDKLSLNGAKIIGCPKTEVENAMIAPHIIGNNNNEIMYIDKNNIDLIIALELIDYTVSEYIFDSNALGKNKAIITIGHFNTEEPGMEYMLEYMPEVLDTHIPTYFVKSGDMYNYI